MDRLVYFDNAATTKIDEEVLEKMLPYLKEEYGNPSSIYSLGRNAKKGVEKAREQIAKAINASVNEIYFTGSGSEADNWAILGAAYKNSKKGKHIISSKIEHHAVLHSLDKLQQDGFEIELLDVDENGLISIDNLKSKIRNDTILITIMYANNEIGTIQKISEIAKIANEQNILFHTDAVQAIGSIEVDVKKDKIDMLSLSAHKIYGPKGVGVLYIKSGVNIGSFIHGGGQERKKRAGTENVASIVGLGYAIEKATANLIENSNYVKNLRDTLFDKITKFVPYIKINGDIENRLPGNVNVSVEFIEGESLILTLDLNGVAVSSGSACTSGSLDPSHVLLAIGLKHEIAHGSLRLSLGKNNTIEEVEYFMSIFPSIVEKLRNMSPLWEQVKQKEKK